MTQNEKRLDGEQWVAVIRAMATAVAEQKDTLSHLDATVGDGDHGLNMAAGMAAAANKAEQLADPTPASVLKSTGSSLMNDMGGASGMIFGAFFRSCGNAVDDKRFVDKEDIGSMLPAALASVQKRGKVQPGDKTMVDALAPATEAYQAAMDSHLDMKAALKIAANAAQAGAESTRNMVAKVGRAKFLGERSLGHQDAGATTMALLFAAWAETISCNP